MSVHVLRLGAVWFALFTVLGGCVGRADVSGGDVEPEEELSSDAALPMLDGGVFADGPETEPALALLQVGGEGPVPRDAARGLDRFARVDIELRMSGLDEVSLTIGPDTTRWPVGSVSSLAQTLELAEDGPVTLVAHGFVQGKRVREAHLTLEVAAPSDPSCFGHLDALGLEWTFSEARPGIEEPVVVGPQFGELALRHRGQSAPKAVVADCEFALRLAAMAETLRPYDIRELIHLGIYNYRCIGGGHPATDGCRPSQHAFARALDIHELVDGEGRRFNVEDDWVITDDVACAPFGDAPMPHPEDPDALLREVACDLFQDGVFHIVLTPNYNAAHRNHLHVDVTPGASSLHELIVGVDPAGLVSADEHH